MKTNATLTVEIIDIVRTLDNKSLAAVLDVVKGYANIETPVSKDNGLVKKSEPKKVEYTKLHCIKGVPSKVWSAINHDFVDNFNGKWVKGKKKGTGYWEFANSTDCENALKSQTDYATSKGVEVSVGTLA